MGLPASALAVVSRNSSDAAHPVPETNWYVDAMIRFTGLR